MEILRKRPRSPKVLYELGVVYESMHDFERAREIIEPLKMMGEETRKLETFLRFSELVSRRNAGAEEKVPQLLALLASDPELYRFVIAELLKLDTRIAWEQIDTQRLGEILDILWFLPNSQLDLDIISDNAQLGTLYYAKGYLQKPMAQSGIFALDLIAKARENGFEEADLHFSYLCKKCKQSFPVSFKRCPNCMAINSVKVEEQVAKAEQETNYSLL